MAYTNLPGFDVHLRDGGLVITRPEFTTGSLLIIGPLTTPKAQEQVATPLWVSNQSQFEVSFGAENVGSPLFNAWKQAADAGCQNVLLLELLGSTAAQKYTNLHEIYKILEDANVDAVALVGIYADDDVSGATIPQGEIDFASYIEVEVEDEALGEGDGEETTFTLNNIPQADSVVIKVDGVAVTSGVTIEEDSKTVTFNTAPSAGKVITADYTYLKSKDVAAQLAGFCRQVSERVSQTLGFVALKPAAANDLGAVKSYITALEGKGPQIFDGLLQLVGGPHVYFEGARRNRYKDSGVAAYAAMVTTLAAQSAPTNKALPGALGLDYNLSPAQLDTLCGLNIVTFRNKLNRVVVTDAMTTAGQTSDFTRLTTVRIVNDAIESIRTVADPFIGEPNDLPQRNALSTAITSALEAMKKVGAISAYRFAIESTPYEVISGRIRINLELVPAFELRKITTTITLRPSL